MFAMKYATERDMEYMCSYGMMPESVLERNDEMMRKIRDRRCYILYENETRIGVMRYNLIFDFTPFVTLIYLDEPHRGKGYGALAMARWEGEMRSLGYKMVMTSTQVDEDAQHFYRKLGYKDMGAIVIDIPPYEQPLEMFMGKGLS